MVDEPPTRPGRAAYVIAQLFSYLLAVIGVGLLLGGTVGTLFGVRQLVLPREFETARDGLRAMLIGLTFALPGLVLLWASLREARRREGGPFVDAFWGSSLYFHLVALVSLAFLLVGIIGMLGAVVSLVVPPCLPRGTVTYGPGGPLASSCPTEASDGLRQLLDFSIFAIVAGPAFWWDLYQGRRLVARPEAP